MHVIHFTLVHSHECGERRRVPTGQPICRRPAAAPTAERTGRETSTAWYAGRRGSPLPHSRSEWSSGTAGRARLSRARSASRRLRLRSARPQHQNLPRQPARPPQGRQMVNPRPTLSAVRVAPQNPRPPSHARSCKRDRRSNAALSAWLLPRRPPRRKRTLSGRLATRRPKRPHARRTPLGLPPRNSKRTAQLQRLKQRR